MKQTRLHARRQHRSAKHKKAAQEQESDELSRQTREPSEEEQERGWKKIMDSFQFEFFALH